MKCPHCGGYNILEDVGVLDRGMNNHSHNLTLVTQNDPSALIFKGAIEAPVRAKVCASCGYVMLFADPKDITNLKDGLPPKF